MPVMRRRARRRGALTVDPNRDPHLILLNRIERAGLPAPTCEVRAVPNRRYRWDCGWQLTRDRWLLVEVQGGIYVGGHHTRGRGYEDDAEKRATATMLGHVCLDVTPGQVRSGQAVEWIRHLLERAA